MEDDNELCGSRQQEIVESAIVEPPASERDSATRAMNQEELSKSRAEELNRLYLESSLPKGFKFDEDDWLIYQKESEGEAPTPIIRICSRLEVIARTRDQIGDNHGRLLRFLDPDGIEHRWAMPMEFLASDGAAYRQELLSRGLMIDSGKSARHLLTTYIQTSCPTTTVRCVEHTGWNKDRTAFVFQNETVGKCCKEPLILQTTLSVTTTQIISGTLTDWQQVAAQCVGNSRLIFAVSAAFAPPLLFPLGIENGGIHFRGGSSSGKTTCLRAAASVWGGPDYVQQWRATANGLEGTAAAHNDCLLCLDEMGQLDPSELGKIAYMLANGVGKTRADKLGNSRKRMLWRLLFLSSGEIALTDHMLEAKQRARAGQEVRVLDIPADGQKYGCFQDLHGAEQGKIFSERLVDLCKSYHGTAGLEFVKCLLPRQDEVISHSRRLMTELSRKYVPTNASGQVQRAFNRFALIAAAGELATTFGITGWLEGTAIEAAMLCFNDWLRARGDTGPQEEKAILSQIRLFFEQHGESRLSPWNAEEKEKHGKTQMRVGFRKASEDGEEFFVLPESFKRDICSGFDPELVAQVCLKHKFLMPDTKGGATRSERLPGAKNSTRVYRFTSKVLSGDE